MAVQLMNNEISDKLKATGVIVNKSIADIGDDELQDLLVHDSLFKIHYFSKLINSYSNDLENLIMGVPVDSFSKERLDELTASLKVYCNIVNAESDFLNEKAAKLFEMCIADNDNSGGDADE